MASSGPGGRTPMPRPRSRARGRDGSPAASDVNVASASAGSDASNRPRLEIVMHHPPAYQRELLNHSGAAAVCPGVRSILTKHSHNVEPDPNRGGRTMNRSIARGIVPALLVMAALAGTGASLAQEPPTPQPVLV